MTEKMNAKQALSNALWYAYKRKQSPLTPDDLEHIAELRFEVEAEEAFRG